ncbi:hypothetical protein ABBQ38_001720 [Trebouxia sp. C0009 RCD-2024]
MVGNGPIGAKSAQRGQLQLQLRCPKPKLRLKFKPLKAPVPAECPKDQLPVEQAPQKSKKTKKKQDSAKLAAVEPAVDAQPAGATSDHKNPAKEEPEAQAPRKQCG